MSTRTISTVILLCASALGSPAAEAQPLTDAEGYPLVGNLMLKGGTARPAPPPDEKAGRELLELRTTLAKVKLDTARTDARFRPLCDAEGNPRVRDVAASPASGPAPRTQPSQYCAEVRKGLS